ncbi:hypothetical protein [Streptomyces bohaiensis]|uniref:hypothetical protein n=1 Tax=Streptomyces bohaiensis TaxID=1431344 RepID=UPI00143C0380|nr:hypothetical protein [Streptomyces bohaiensis]
MSEAKKAAPGSAEIAAPLERALEYPVVSGLLRRAAARPSGTRLRPPPPDAYGRSP